MVSKQSLSVLTIVYAIMFASIVDASITLADTVADSTKDVIELVKKSNTLISNTILIVIIITILSVFGLSVFIAYRYHIHRKNRTIYPLTQILIMPDPPDEPEWKLVNSNTDTLGSSSSGYLICSESSNNNSQSLKSAEYQVDVLAYRIHDSSSTNSYDLHDFETVPL